MSGFHSFAWILYNEQWGLVVFILTYTESLSQFSIKHVETFDKDHVYVYSFLVIYSCWRDASWHKQTTSRGERININSSNSFRVKDLHFTCAKTITRSEKQNEFRLLRLHCTILIFESHSQHIPTHEPKYIQHTKSYRWWILSLKTSNRTIQVDKLQAIVVNSKANEWFICIDAQHLLNDVNEFDGWCWTTLLWPHCNVKENTNLTIHIPSLYHAQTDLNLFSLVNWNAIT